MPLIFLSLIIFGILLLFSRTKIGKTLLLLYVLLVGINLIILAFEKEPYISFIEDNDLVIDRAKKEFSESGPPWYHASDEDNYYYIVPGFYRVMPKDNECKGFSRFNINTWCIESPEDFKCYPGTSGKKSCGAILVDP